MGGYEPSESFSPALVLADCRCYATPPVQVSFTALPPRLLPNQHHGSPDRLPAHKFGSCDGTTSLHSENGEVRNDEPQPDGDDPGYVDQYGIDYDHGFKPDLERFEFWFVRCEPAIHR